MEEPKHISLQEPEVQLRVKGQRKKANRRERHTLPATNVAFQADELSVSFQHLGEDMKEVHDATPRAVDEYDMPSTAVQTVYMEVRDGFRPLDCNQLTDSKQTTSINDTQVKHLMSDLAVLCHSKFVRLCKLSHGLLAGLALGHCLVIYALSPPFHEWEDFLDHYTSLAHGFQSIFYFFNVMCVISVFDRYDLSSIDWSYFSGLRRGKLGVLTTILYPLSLLFTLCITNTDDRIGLYQHTKNSTEWWSQLKDAENMLESWRSVSLVRNIGIMVAWFLFGISSDADLLKKHLKEIK